MSELNRGVRPHDKANDLSLFVKGFNLLLGLVHKSHSGRSIKDGPAQTSLNLNPFTLFALRVLLLKGS